MIPAQCQWCRRKIVLSDGVWRASDGERQCDMRVFAVAVTGGAGHEPEQGKGRVQ